MEAEVAMEAEAAMEEATGADSLDKVKNKEAVYLENGISLFCLWILLLQNPGLCVNMIIICVL